MCLLRKHTFCAPLNIHNTRKVFMWSKTGQQWNLWIFYCTSGFCYTDICRKDLFFIDFGLFFFISFWQLLIICIFLMWSSPVNLCLLANRFQFFLLHLHTFSHYFQNSQFSSGAPQWQQWTVVAGESVYITENLYEVCVRWREKRC